MGLTILQIVESCGICWPTHCSKEKIKFTFQKENQEGCFQRDNQLRVTLGFKITPLASPSHLIFRVNNEICSSAGWVRGQIKIEGMEESIGKHVSASLDDTVVGIIDI